MFVARPSALVLALFVFADAGSTLPRSETGHKSACDACCACTHYLSSAPRRASLCRWGSCHKSGDTSDGRFCWDTVWDPAYTAKSARWGSPCGSESGWPHSCWNAKCSKPDGGGGGSGGGSKHSHKHASAFAPFGSFTKCAAGEHKPFYGALGMGGHRDCHALCESGGGAEVSWKSGKEQLFFCQAVAAHFTAKSPKHFAAPKALSQARFPMYDIGGNRCKVNADGTAGKVLQSQMSAAAQEPYLCLDKYCGLCKCKCGLSRSQRSTA